jgi:DNA-binding XRE family transcriptional regulator
MAIWAMKNAGYTREETAKWLGLTRQPMEMEKAGGMNHE